ncbi:MAG: hypothetical protein BA864_02630 [Desulfuromonadales bacterium C00003093]|nr:MAG: hypothetical protein BA864_02630 [Desulfuromonadales bacterium C00003093]
MNSRIAAVAFVLAVLMFCPPPAQARMVHYFDCAFCHQAFTSAEVPYMTYNLCLTCHYPGNSSTYELRDGTDSNPVTGTFASGDASNAMGSYPVEATPGDETSHYWAGSADIVPAAGAGRPADFMYNFGWSNGKVTCSRCHDPHAAQSNPKLLRMGAGSTDSMCLDCHQDWNLTGNHGLESHPMHADYPTLAAANPDKFRAAPDNFGTNGSISLVDGTKVSCTSCHGVHFADSEASTDDDPAASLLAADGKLLKFDGPDKEDPNQSLCQTCHIYPEHGSDSGTGCMVCHGGHEYDAGGNPNYFMLKKQITLVTPKSGIEETVNLNYTNYPTPANWGGLCQQCHTLSAGHDADSNCKDCHSHTIGFSHGVGSTGDGCAECHGHDAGTNYDPDMTAPYAAGATASQGNGTFQSHSTHTETAGGDAKGPGIYCNDCHDINNFPYFKSGTDGNADGKYNLAETDVCDTCHSPGGTYDGIDDVVIGAKSIWSTGAYTGTDSNVLVAGKEKWCASCHDEEPSVISGVAAPNVIGDEDGNYTYGTGWGYYMTGHGLTADETFPSKGGVETLSGRAVECDSCHDYATVHVDGEPRTYDDGDSSSIDSSIYRLGYRLKLIDGQEPLKVPRPFGTANTVDSFRTCFQVGCHDSGPFIDSGNMNTNLVTDGSNRHEYHLHVINLRFASDWSGAYNSSMTCVNCHNVHGSTRLAMVRDGKLTDREPGLQIWYKNDNITFAPYGPTPPEPEDLPLPASDGTAWIGASSINLCSHCHGNSNVLTEDRLPFQDVSQAPVLEWSGDNSYTSDGVSPDSAVGHSTFTFRISYADSNNDSPSPIEIWVDLNDNGSYEGDEKYVMAETDTMDTNLLNGKIYTKSLSIAKAGDGILRYRFYAHDGVLEATGVPTVDSTVTILNNLPTLTWTGETFYQTDGTNPDIGGNGSTFTFRIDYADSDNEVPSTIQVWVDENDNDSYEADEKYDLSEVDSGDTTYNDGKFYARSLPLAHAGDGTLQYRFYAADATDTASGAPTQDTMLTVQVGANSPPALEFVDAGCIVNGVKPQSGATGADFVFTVRYTDSDNEIPSTIQVWVDENDDADYGVAEKYALTEVDSGDTTYSDGKLYSTTRALTLAGDNALNYRFYATDGIDTAVGEATGDHSVTVVDALKVRPAGGSGWYSTIQSAILDVDAENGAHTILVYEGTYNEDVLLTSLDDRNIMLRSVCGPGVTIINGSGSGSTVTFNRYSGDLLDGFQVTGGTTGVTINGTEVTINNCQIHDNNGLNGGGISVIQSGSMPELTLTNSEIYNNSSDRGGGVRIWRGTEAGHTISNSIIRNNTAIGDSLGDGGGGLHLSQAPNITISNLIIRDNTTVGYAGGGLYVSQVPELTISDSIIRDNTSDKNGGGVFNDASTIDFIRSSITGNTASDLGGAITHSNSTSNASFENCIVADNRATQAGMASLNGGIFDIVNSTIADNQATGSNSGAIYNQFATVTIRNSILWGNQAATDSHIAHFNGGSMTITDSIIQGGDDGDFTNAPFFGGNVVPVVSGFTSGNDPLFVGSGDYHIQAFSSAIDNASATYAPALDIDGQNRPQAAADDIGADEYYP